MRPPIFVIYFFKYNCNTNAVSIKFPIEVYYKIEKMIPEFTEKYTNKENLTIKL